jgi:TatD DNase family protein
MIDTHCHLTDERLLSQLSEVLARAGAAGVTRMITIGTTPDDARAAIALCRGRPNLRCAVGVHPNHSHEVDPDELPVLRELQDDESVAALGEMGLDYHWDFAPRDRQRRCFEFQLALASEVGRPVVIHCREATDDCLAVMRGFPRVRAVFHCFTGTPAEAQKILGQGYLLGFTGAVTFKRNDALREAVRLTPLDRLLVETDSPYMTPEPMRKQKVNEPALVVHVAEVVAREKGLSYPDFDRVVMENAATFFGWGD